MRKLAVGCSLALFVTAWSVSGARADAADEATIESARELWFDADFEGARDGFVRVLERPDLTPAQAIDAHRYLAVLFLVLGDEETSRAHADAAAALDPNVTPPEGSPRIADDLFRMANRRLAGRALTLSVAVSGSLEVGASSTIVARAEPAPSALVHSIRLRCGAADATEEGATVSVELVPRGLVACTAEVLSSGGAVLASRSEELVPIGGELSGADPARERARRRRLLGGVIASIAAAAGAATFTSLYLRDREVQFGSTSVVGW